MRRRTLLARVPGSVCGRAGASDDACSGSDAALCRRISAAGSDGSNTHAVRVQRGATTLAEACFSGRDKPAGTWFERELVFTAAHPHDLRSISKSVTGLVAGILARCTAQGLKDLAQATLCDPLGIPPVTWRCDREGRTQAFSGLLRPAFAPA